MEISLRLKPVFKLLQPEIIAALGVMLVLCCVFHSIQRGMGARVEVTGGGEKGGEGRE